MDNLYGYSQYRDSEATEDREELTTTIIIAVNKRLVTALAKKDPNEKRTILRSVVALIKSTIQQAEAEVRAQEKIAKGKQQLIDEELAAVKRSKQIKELEHLLEKGGKLQITQKLLDQYLR